MIRFQIRLDETSFQILRGLAEREYRDPRYQAALLIRESLELRGLLDAQDQPGYSQNNQGLLRVQDAS